MFEYPGYKKIIELQTRREYDFFGELPHYTGFEYRDYYDQIKQNKDVIGLHVWCQTGGWGKTNKITFLENSSPFVELNTISTINIFQGRDPYEEIKKYSSNKDFVEFIKKYNEISNKILYPQKSKTRYFNKIYIPPIIWVYWNNITINNLTASFVKYFYKPIKIRDSEFE